MRIIAMFGDEAVAGYVIAIRLIIFTILPSWGLSNAAATLVGQNLGAGQPDRAERSVWRAGLINTIFLVSVSLIYIIFAPWIIQLFDDTPAVVEAGVVTLRIICLGYVFFAYGMVLSQAFNGAGDTRTPMLINIFCFWLLEIPLGYFLAVTLDMGLAGVCWAIAIAETALAIIAAILFRRGTWKQVSI
jgi:Na+-driven multidrug efflux pump